jgi:hypothetical protein
MAVRCLFPEIVESHLCFYAFPSFANKYKIVPHAYKIFVRKPEGKRPLRRPRHRWEDNVRLNLREVGWERHRLDSSSSG